MDNVLKRILLFAVLLSAAFLTGCPQPLKPEVPKIIESKATIEAASAALKAHSSNVAPLLATANVRIFYYKDGEEKQEPSDAHLAFDPPKKLFFRAKRLGIEVVWAGSNNEEFWLRLQPKEISQYFWGYWKQLDGCSSSLLVSPQSMLDALGMVSVDSSWKLYDIDGQDVLVKPGESGAPVKKIFINRAGYLVSRIEYFDKYGIKVASADMANYTPSGGGSPIPKQIDITTYDLGKITAKVRITLNNPRLLTPDKIKSGTFKRPDSKGIKSVYKMSDNCKFQEQ